MQSQKQGQDQGQDQGQLIKSHKRKIWQHMQSGSAFTLNYRINSFLSADDRAYNEALKAARKYESGKNEQVLKHLHNQEKKAAWNLKNTEERNQRSIRTLAKKVKAES